VKVEPGHRVLVLRQLEGHGGGEQVRDRRRELGKEIDRGSIRAANGIGGSSPTIIRPVPERQ
jgi:hypothetical protein